MEKAFLVAAKEVLKEQHLMEETDFADAVRELAADYGIGSCEIWDILPEIAT